MSGTAKGNRPVIRPMAEADIERVVALEREIFSDAWPRRAFQEMFEEDAWQALVAEVESSVIAYACFFFVAGEVHLANIAVDAPYRRKSVAKLLLRHILQLARDARCGVILLEVRESNAAARNFYRQAGFTELYQRKGYYRNPVENAIVMSKTLSPAGDDDINYGMV